MTPPPKKSLARIVSELRRAQRLAAERQMPPFDEAAIEAYVRQESENRFGFKDVRALLDQIDTRPSTRNLLRSAVQGATMDWGDEALGLVNPEAGDEMRLRGDMFREDEPILDMAAGMAGALPVAGGVAKALPRLGAMTGIPAAMSMGAGSGAVAGAGSAPPGERRAGAEAGGVFGALLGTGFGAAGSAYSALSPAEAARRRVAAAAQLDAPEIAARVGAYEASGLSPAGRAADPIGADFGPALTQELDNAVTTSPAARVQAASIFGDRQSRRAGRLYGDLASETGDVVAETEARNYGDDLKRWANEAYGSLREGNARIKFTPDEAKDWEQLVKQPVVQDAWRRAENTVKIGDMAPRAVSSFEALQTFKTQLDDAIEANFRKGAGQAAENLKTVRDKLVETMRQKVPGYKKIDAEYARRNGVLRAWEMGKDFWNSPDPRDMVRTLLPQLKRGGDPEQLEAFRRAVASEALAELQRAKTNQSIATQIENMSQAKRDRIKEAFKTPEQFQRYLRLVELEAQQEATNKVLGNSMTAFRQNNARMDPVELAGGAATGGAGVAIPAVTRLSSSARQRAVGTRVGELLMQPGIEFNRNMLASALKPDATRLMSSGSYASPIVASRLAGLLANRNR